MSTIALTLTQDDAPRIASERAINRASGILYKSGIAPRDFTITSAGVGLVHCVDAAQAVTVARLTGGVVMPPVPGKVSLHTVEVMP